MTRHPLNDATNRLDSLSRGPNATELAERMAGIHRRILQDTFALGREKRGSPEYKRRRNQIAADQAQYEEALAAWRQRSIDEAVSRVVDSHITMLWSIRNALPGAEFNNDPESPAGVREEWRAVHRAVMTQINTAHHQRGY